MIVKITSKEITGLENIQYDLTSSGHFVGFINKLEELFDRKKEFTVLEIKEHEFYFHQDTSYSKTMLAVTNYKVNKKFVLKALDERGVYYITKSCIIEIESVAIFDPTILRH